MLAADKALDWWMPATRVDLDTFKEICQILDPRKPLPDLENNPLV